MSMKRRTEHQRWLRRAHLAYSDSIPTIRFSVSRETPSIGMSMIRARTIDCGVSFTLMMSKTANPRMKRAVIQRRAPGR